MPLQVDVDEVGWTEKLVSLGLIRRSEADDPRAVAHATTAFLDTVEIADVTP